MTNTMQALATQLPSQVTTGTELTPANSGIDQKKTEGSFLDYYIDRLTTSPFSVIPNDVLAFTQYASETPDIRIKIEGLNALLAEKGEDENSAATVASTANELFRSILEDAASMDFILPATWIRETRDAITDAVIKAHHYGEASHIDAALTARRMLFAKAEKLYDDLKLQYAAIPTGSNDGGIINQLGFDAVTYLQKFVPFNQRQGNFRAQKPTWFKVSDRGLEHPEITAEELDKSAELDVREIPYQILSMHDGVYVRIEEKEKDLVEEGYQRFIGIVDENKTKLLALADQVSKLDTGIASHRIQQAGFIAEIERINFLARESLKLSSQTEKPTLADLKDMFDPKIYNLSFASPKEAEFESDVVLASDYAATGEYDKAIDVLNKRYDDISNNISRSFYQNPEGKMAAILNGVLDLRSKKVLHVVNRESVQILAAEQMKDVKRLNELCQDNVFKVNPESIRYKFIASGYEAEAYEWVGNLERALLATDEAVVIGHYYLQNRGMESPFNYADSVFDARLNRPNYVPSEKEVEAALSLANTRARIIRGIALKHSQGEAEENSAKFKKQMREIDALIYTFEKIADAKLNVRERDEYKASMRENKAAMLWVNKQWKDLAIYVRDNIDEPFWNTASSKFLRESNFSYIPKNLRGVDGKILKDFDSVDWGNVGEKMEASLRAASNHLFDLPWWAGLGMTLGGCAVGTLAMDGPWGCVIGSSVGFTMDVGTSMLIADETHQSFYTGYSSSDWNTAGRNFAMGAGAMLLNAVGFKWNGLVLGKWGTALAKGSTWVSGGKIVYNLGEGLVGTAWGILKTTYNAGRFIGYKVASSEPVLNAASKLAGRTLTAPQVSEQVLDKTLKTSAKNLWGALTGETRNLGDYSRLSFRDRVRVLLTLKKYNQTAATFVENSPMAALKGMVDLIFHSAERASLPYLGVRWITGNPEIRKDDPYLEMKRSLIRVLRGVDAFMLMFLFTRLGVRYLGIDKGGTRLMFLLDRVQDILTQKTSGAELQNIDWKKAAMNYIWGSLPGQIRGRITKNLEGAIRSFTNGIEVKIGDFASGKIAWGELTEVERKVIEKLLPHINSNGTILLKANVPESIVEVWLQKPFRKAIQSPVVVDGKPLTLTVEEWKTLSRVARPTEFSFADFSNASATYQYYLGVLRGGGPEAQEAKQIVNILDRLGGMVKGDVEAQLLIRNNFVYKRVARGRLAKLGDTFTDGSASHLVKLGKISSGERKLLRGIAEPLAYNTADYAPGTLAYCQLSNEQRAVIDKLYAATDQTPNVVLKIQGGRVLKEGFMGKMIPLKNVAFENGVFSLTVEEEMILRNLLGGPKALSLTAAAGGLVVKLAASFNFKGILFFCLIHDAIIGTLYDETRGQLTMQTDPGMMGGWTFLRSITTLWPREWAKLALGWDKPWAVLMDRLMGREVLDPIMTKFINLWPGKGLWRQAYEEILGDGVTDFIDGHVAVNPLKGGLFLYSPSAVEYLVDGETEGTPYSIMPVAAAILGELYSTGVMLKDDELKEVKKLTPEDYKVMEGVLDSLYITALKIVKEYDKDSSKRIWIGSEYYRKDVVLDLVFATAAAVYYTNQKDPKKFADLIKKYPEIFNFIEIGMSVTSDSKTPTKENIAIFVDKVVRENSLFGVDLNDTNVEIPGMTNFNLGKIPLGGDYELPALFRKYMEEKVGPAQ